MPDKEDLPSAKPYANQYQFPSNKRAKPVPVKQKVKSRKFNQVIVNGVCVKNLHGVNAKRGGMNARKINPQSPAIKHHMMHVVRDVEPELVSTEVLLGVDKYTEVHRKGFVIKSVYSKKDSVKIDRAVGSRKEKVGPKEGSRAYTPKMPLAYEGAYKPSKKVLARWSAKAARLAKVTPPRVQRKTVAELVSIEVYKEWARDAKDIKHYNEVDARRIRHAIDRHLKKGRTTNAKAS